MLALAGLLLSLAGSSFAYVLSPFGLGLDGRATALASGCSATGTASCTNTSSVSDLCCFESPGGLLLQTQFWDTSPPTGPNDSWTIHGKPPSDFLSVAPQNNCDPSRAYTGIASFWRDINGNDETFWAGMRSYVYLSCPLMREFKHEWSTHGTCMSTLKTACLPAGSPTGAEAVAFFNTVIKLFKTLPTYTWLKNQGITPDATTTHTLSSLVAALKAESGFTPALDCSGSNLNAITWYFHLRGSIIDGTFVPINAPESGSCASTGIRYPTKGGSTGGGGDGGLPARATIHASSVGGILSLGTWSTQTLATFTLTGTLTRNCGVSGGTFACGSGVSLTSFSAVSSGGSLLLASGGSTTWGSDGVPSGTTVFPIFTGSSHAQDYTLSIVAA
ncbi:ribonuclease T2 [Mycena rebaudengoi]|nr:ribonuclease T2 [Mycena rebaudengoi]